MERKIPQNLKHPVLTGIMGFRESKYREEYYLERVEKMEKQWEERMNKLLEELNIHASQKTDRFSLPYNNEIKVTMRGSSWMASAYEFKRFARPVVKELMSKNVYRVRFYILAEPDTERGKHIFDRMGSISYTFRYYLRPEENE